MAKKPLEDTSVPVRRGVVLPEPLKDMPEYIEELGSDKRGFENTSREDIFVPMLALCQSNSPQRKETSDRFIKGLQEGDFFHSINGTIYGRGPIYITPLFKFDTAFRLDKDIQFECRSDDSRKCPKYGVCVSRNWGPDGEPPVCSLVKNVPVVIYGDSVEDYAILGFKSTQLGKFKDLWSKMKATKKPVFAHVFKLSSIPESEGSYSWFGMKLEPAGWAPKDVYDEAERMYADLLEQFKQGKLKVDLSGMEADLPGGQARPDTEM